MNKAAHIEVRTPAAPRARPAARDDRGRGSRGERGSAHSYYSSQQVQEIRSVFGCQSFGCQQCILGCLKHFGAFFWSLQPALRAVLGAGRRAAGGVAAEGRGGAAGGAQRGLQCTLG